MPKIEEAFHSLAGMRFFGKIDLKGAYNQIAMNSEAREITTINTPIGLLRWTVVPYGIKTASAMFQRAIEDTIGTSVQNCVIFQDDIAIGGDSEADLKKNGLCFEKIETSRYGDQRRKNCSEGIRNNFSGI